MVVRRSDKSRDDLPSYVPPGKFEPTDDEMARGREAAARLRGEIEGEVRFDAGDRAIYSTDASSYRQLPIGVVLPKSVDDVLATVEVCRALGLPVLPRGGGTSLAGQCCNTAVVIDCSKYLTAILEVDRDAKLARVQPGVVLDTLRHLGTSGEPQVTFGPTPSTHDHCTIGGMIGNNACGNYSIMSEFYGAGPRMAHNVAEMEVLLYDGTRMRVGKTPEDELDRKIAGGGRTGQVYGRLRDLRDRFGPLVEERFPTFPRRVSGYNLEGLLPECGFDLAYALTGTEGTCVSVLEATLRLVDYPPARSLVVVGFEDVYRAAAQVPKAREFKPIALEGFDEVLIGDNRSLGRHVKELEMLPEGRGWLMAEFGGEDKRAADAAAEAFLVAMRKGKGCTGERLFDDEKAESAIWSVRESGLGATAYLPGRADTFEGWEDSAVPPENLPGYLRGLRDLFESFGYKGCALYGHFGQGCVHTRIPWNPHSAEGVATWRRFLDEASDLALEYGGSFSGEHGDGQSRAELLDKMYGKEVVEAFREFKGIWDPDWKMNPGKVVDPYPIVSNLRLGPDYAPPAVRVHFSYEEDGGSFAHAAARCVGVGNCRHDGGGVMCPSYMVTRDERDSTRGRARVLFEMMRGTNEEIKLWRSDEVAEALDLCLSCKGCKSDCPVNVDMATYKAEFLSHHYRRRLRPRVAYAMGLVHWWLRAGSKAPRLANGLLSAPVVSGLLKRAAGIDPRRPAPALVGQTFLEWFQARPRRDRGGPQVLLWPDTFTNFLHPDIGRAHVQVLEAAGFHVTVPETPLCCGRPLYDYGMLDTAERLLRRMVAQLAGPVEAGVPVVGMEASCVAVLRDELPALRPHDLDARRLSDNSFMLSEFLMQRAPDWEIPPLARPVVYHGHCHLKAVVGLDAERAVLDRMGATYEVLDSGCCGLAGSFGFEKGRKYDVSVGAAERSLLPSLRQAPEETLVVTDGFSCRTQIAQLAGREAVHLAEAVKIALDESPARDRAAPQGAVSSLWTAPAGYRGVWTTPSG
jgi:FAD/FMN-containing dehydrogenase/Fe-S oxidoreductase